MEIPDMTLATLETKPVATAEITLKPLSDLGDTGPVIGEEAGRPVLMGGECHACGKRSFPLRALCPYCASADTAAVAIASEGMLYSYTTVHVSSTRPTPYTIGYVDLDRNVRTLALITGDPAQLRPDMAVRLVVADGGWSFAAPTNAPEIA
jgi:uncharacterized protein